MIASSLLTLYRSLTRHKLFAFLNIGGLALGIAVFLVLFLFVQFETGFDRHFPGANKLWVIEEYYNMPGYPTDPNPYTMGGELDQLKGDFPDLVGTRYDGLSAIVRQGDQSTSENVFAVDGNFFQLFQYPVAQGNATTALADPDGLVITQKIARKYFGDRSAIGKQLTLVINGKTYSYQVGAVLKDLPKDLTFNGDMYIRLIRDRFAGDFFDHWGSTSLFTFLRFPNAAAAHAFTARLPDFLQRHAGPTGNFTPHVADQYRQDVRPISQLHLFTNSDKVTVATLGLVGLLTLMIAIVNYVNLATARAGLRAREVAVRKTLGGTRRALIGQFLFESVMTVLVAALLGLALTEIALPFINAAGGLHLSLTYFGAGSILPILLGTVVLVGIVAGLYPAFVLSGFRPAAVLASARAPGGGKSGARLRQGLVIAQFAIALLFTIATIVMIAQARHVRTANLGFDRNGLIVVNSFADGSLDTTQRHAILAAFRRVPGVVSVASGNNAPGSQNATNAETMNRPDMPDRKPSVMWIDIGSGYFGTYGTKLLAGRLFDAPHRAADDTAGQKNKQANVILNATAVTALGFADPQDAIGKPVKAGRNLTVVGVIADQRFGSPHDPVRATAYYLNTETQMDPFAGVRYSGDAKTMQNRLEAVWRRVVPGVPFAARTVNANLYERYYKDDAQRSRLFTIGAVLAVLIGCIGLYGLASFDTARRVREIGIRKVLGASTRDIMHLLIGQFLRPVLLANLIAWPLAYFAMRKWLAGFDDRIALSPAYFVAATLLALLIACTTIFGQAWRVARAEPARALRDE
ncbi:ABC transporter permease [Stakelama sediminis]|uniref:Putative ABC transport system permease protein n=1 Tax=Stakelama sediminis TaxID=463200 RepID=A0A840YZK6_9SPHN|nr:ABC transporter permease [Stakelama sediminis]MBB5718936.1 putative ABC transport system permease protein [Stakelama sediminis]